MDVTEPYCILTGVRYMTSCDEVGSYILRECYGNAPFRRRQKGRKRPVSKEVMEGLSYSGIDGCASEELVLICCYEKEEDGSIKLLTELQEDPPAEITIDNVKEILNVAPRDFPDYGEYKNRYPEEWDTGNYKIRGKKPMLLINEGAYLFSKKAAPKLQPHVLLRLQRYFNTTKPASYSHFPPAKFVDYGPVSRTQGQWVDWVGLHTVVPRTRYCRQDAIDAWTRLFSEKDQSDSDILEKAWRGPGNMWCLVSPHQFPIDDSEASFVCHMPEHDEPHVSNLAGLPFDILTVLCEFFHPRSICALMGTCTFIRSILLKPANRVVRAYITANEPWFLPVESLKHVEFRGLDEIDYWTSEWAKKGYNGDNFESRIPWLGYRRACSHSMSMWNRIRIWRVACELEKLAVSLDLLD